MRLNNKGFAISSIMYIILVMAILIITVTLSVLSSRKLVLDKLKSEILNKINQDIELSYSDTLKKIKEATQSYINDGHNIDDTYIDSVSIDNLKVNNYLSISDKVLNYYNLNDKYVGFKNSNSIYSFMIGKEVDYNDLKGDLLDIVDYHIEGQSVQNGTPTPDNPVEIESVGENKNLFDASLWSNAVTNSGLTIQYLTNEDCFLINGTAQAAGDFVLQYINIPSEPNTSYVLSTKYVSGSVDRTNGAGNKYAIAYFGNGDTINARNNWYNIKLDNEDVVQVAKTNDKSYVTGFWFHISQGVKFDNYKVKIQLEEGTTATSYGTYGKYVVPIKLTGKNLFNIDAIGGSAIANGSAEKISNGWKVKGSYSGSTSPEQYGNGWFRPGDVEGSVYIKANQKITVSADVKLIKASDNYKDNNNIRIYLYGANNYTASSQTFSSDSTTRIKQTYTVGVSGNYYPVFTLQDNELEITNIQIEVGDKNTYYEPYVKSTTISTYLSEPLRKVGDYADYIDYKSGKVVRCIKKIILDGTEDWSYDSNFKAFKLLDNKFMTVQKPMSNQFIGISSGILNNDNSLLINNDSIYVTRWSLNGDLSKYKESLKENNLKLINVLKSPVEQSMDFQNIVVRGGNKIEIDTSVKPSNVTYKVVEKMFDINV